MPISYSVEKERVYVRAVATGILTVDAVLEYENAVAADSDIEDIRLELFDVSAIQASEIDPPGLETIARAVRGNKKRHPGSKLAIVVSRGTSFENARYYERIADDVHHVIVFNSRDTAQVWLGVTP